MATTIKELKEKINEKNETIKNLRETIKNLTEQHIADQKTIKEHEDKVEGAVQELLGVYLKWITEQYGEEQYGERTGKPLGKFFAFTFQEANDHVFNMDSRYDEEGRLSLLCSSTYPLKEGETDDD